jgi:hypothetical protein
MRAKWVLAVATAIVGVALAAALLSTGRETATAGPSTNAKAWLSHVNALRTKHGLLPCTGPGQTTNFRAFSLGRSFHGLPAGGALRRCGAPYRAGYRNGPVLAPPNFVMVNYGDCDAERTGSCAPPLQVQTWPACERNLSSYAADPSGAPLPHRRLTVRGAPAALFDEGLRLEIYTGASTVVVFGERASLVRRAAKAVRPLTGGRLVRLAPATAGALQGKVRCTSQEGNA